MARYLPISKDAVIGEVELPALRFYRRHWFRAAAWTTVAIVMVGGVAGLIIGAAIA